MGPEERELESFRQDETHLDPIREGRVQHRLAELTSRQGDVFGRTPFQDVLAPPEGASVPSGMPPRLLATDTPDAAAPAGGRHGRPRILAVAAAVVLVLVGGVVVVNTLEDGSDDVVAGLGDGSLASLAERARQRPDRPLADGEYLYQRIDEGVAVTLDGREGVDSGVMERWIDADGRGRERVSERTFTEALTGVVELRTSESDTRYDDPGALRFDRFSYDELRALPDDVAEILRIMASATPGDPIDPTWRARALAELLMNPLVSPPVRAAALEGLDELGLVPVGEVGGASEGRGLGFVLEGETDTTLVIVDPVSGLVTEVVVGSAPTADLPPRPAPPNVWRGVAEGRVTTSLS